MLQFAKKAFGLAIGALVGCTLVGTGADAAVVFSDNFNSYAFQLNWSPPANWIDQMPGSVDLIGETTTGTHFDFYPGNGGYVDMDGSDGREGLLETIKTFAAGTYNLTFDLGGNARGDVPKTTVITLGSFSKSITLPSGAGLDPFTFTFTTTGGRLGFQDMLGGNNDIGNILDNVTLSSVPEPGVWAMLMAGFCLLGLALRGRAFGTARFA